MNKEDYYLARVGEKLDKAGKQLDDAINTTNQVVLKLREAVELFKLAVGATNLQICRYCPKDAKFNKNGINYCGEHWESEEKRDAELKRKAEEKQKRKQARLG